MALGLIARRVTNAAGYAFFRRHSESGKLISLFQGGVAIPEDMVSLPPGDAPLRVAVLRLGNDEGLFSLAFDGPERSLPPSIVEAIGAVWNAARGVAEYARLASDVADLEASLMDSKIADRVRGLAEHPDEDSLEAISRHVESILRPPAGRRMLEQLSRELEQELEERRLSNRAKTILQSVHGLTEEQAHTHLRRVSRLSRRPMREVAATVIEEYAEADGPGRKPGAELLAARPGRTYRLASRLSP